MKILDGNLVSKSIYEQLLVGDLSKLTLAVILIGNDPNSQKYVSLKKARCDELKINFRLHHLPEDTNHETVSSLISDLNRDPAVNGFFIQLPIPKTLTKDRLLLSIDPSKDVDGLNPNSAFTPAVVRGVISLLDYYHISLAEKSAVIINDSKLIGIPLSKILISRNCSVTICNEFSQNIEKISRGADLVFSATGVKGLITDKYIKPGAIAIDIGGGDLDYENIKDLCEYITPPTGGVGPMTIASLIQNLTDIISK